MHSYHIYSKTLVKWIDHCLNTSTPFNAKDNQNDCLSATCARLSPLHSFNVIFQLLSSIDPKNDASVFLGLVRLLAKISPNDFVQLLDSVVEEHLKSVKFVYSINVSFRIQHLQAYAINNEVDLVFMRKHLLPNHFKVYLQALAHRSDNNRLVLQEIRVSHLEY